MASKVCLIRTHFECYAVRSALVQVKVGRLIFSHQETYCHHQEIECHVIRRASGHLPRVTVVCVTTLVAFLGNGENWLDFSYNIQ